jgi:mycofactocin precursor
VIDAGRMYDRGMEHEEVREQEIELEEELLVEEISIDGMCGVY